MPSPTDPRTSFRQPSFSNSKSIDPHFSFDRPPTPSSSGTTISSDSPLAQKPALGQRRLSQRSGHVYKFEQSKSPPGHGAARGDAFISSNSVAGAFTAGTEPAKPSFMLHDNTSRTDLSLRSLTLSSLDARFSIFPDCENATEPVDLDDGPRFGLYKSGSQASFPRSAHQEWDDDAEDFEVRTVPRLSRKGSGLSLGQSKSPRLKADEISPIDFALYDDASSVFAGRIERAQSFASLASRWSFDASLLDFPRPSMQHEGEVGAPMLHPSRVERRASSYVAAVDLVLDGYPQPEDRPPRPPPAPYLWDPPDELPSSPPLHQSRFSMSTLSLRTLTVAGSDTIADIGAETVIVAAVSAPRGSSDLASSMPSLDLTSSPPTPLRRWSLRGSALFATKTSSKRHQRTSSFRRFFSRSPKP